jgi:hypothetical protein
METMFVRLKPLDPRRKFVLRRYAYAGIHFHEARGWHRVAPDIAEHLRGTRQMEFDAYSPAAFDVCTEEEAQTIDARERAESGLRRTALDAVPLSAARPGSGGVTTDDLRTEPEEFEPGVDGASPGRRGRRTER